MFDPFELRIEFFEGLTAIDVAIVERAAEESCRDCRGPLHRGDYPRKPRGGLVGPAAEAFGRRFSLSCGRDGCRHRATPVLATSWIRENSAGPTMRHAALWYS